MSDKIKVAKGKQFWKAAAIQLAFNMKELFYFGLDYRVRRENLETMKQIVHDTKDILNQNGVELQFTGTLNKNLNDVSRIHSLLSKLADDSIKSLKKPVPVCYEIKRGYVRAIVYLSDFSGEIKFIDECKPEKGVPKEKRKEIVEKWLKEKGFEVDHGNKDISKEKN